MLNSFDAIVVGSGPNGLAAAIKLAQTGLSVAIVEAKSQIGGGVSSAELTLPGFIHDVCSTVYPLGIGSPFFRTLPLAQYGLEWIQPQAPLAHPFDNGTAAILNRSVEETVKTLGVDANAYRKIVEPIVANWKNLSTDILAPFHFPKHLFAMLHFAFLAMRSAEGLAKRFHGEHARGLFAGLAAHSIIPLHQPLTATFALILGVLGHAEGWPIVRGGSQQMTQALASLFFSLGGKIFTNMPIESLKQLPASKVILFDVTPKQLLGITGDALPYLYRKRLEKYRYGPGIFKLDWALSQPIPWKAKECLQAGTVHLGGTFEEIAKSEYDVWQNKHPEKPYVLLVQPSLFDPSRAPPGKHTGWAYCHVPNGSTYEMTERVEAQIERFAPGFKDCILARHVRNAHEYEQYNANFVGGDIVGGVQDIYQLFTRPIARIVPYSTPLKNVYICSSSTPPGGGVHGMCGYFAAQAALKRWFNKG